MGTVAKAHGSLEFIANRFNPQSPTTDEQIIPCAIGIGIGIEIGIRIGGAIRLSDSSLDSVELFGQEHCGGKKNSVQRKTFRFRFPTICTRFADMFRSIANAIRPTTATPRRRQNNPASQAAAVESLEARQLLTAVLTEVTGDYVEPFAPVEFNGRLLYAGNDAPRGYQLLSSATDGTEVIHDTTFAVAPFKVNGALLFAAETNDSGVELFRSDGTAAGTTLVKNINLQSAGADSIREVDWAQAVVFKDRLYFVANDGVNGQELWASDGTTSGTVMLQDIKTTGSGNSVVNSLTVSGDTLYFLANDQVHGHELWKTDGTSGGTSLVRDFTPGSQSTILKILRATNDGGILLNARSADSDRGDFALWEIQTDGSANQITTPGQGPVLDAYKFNGDVFLTYEAASDQTENGGIFVKRGGTTTVELFYSDNFSRGGAFQGEVNGRLVFLFSNVSSRFFEFQVLATDGAATEFLSTNHVVYDWFSNNTNGLPVLDHAELNGEWYFVSSNREVTVTDGTTAGTRELDLNGTTASFPIGVGVFNERVWFAAFHRPAGFGRLLFSTDGTQDGTIQEIPQGGFTGLTVTELGPTVTLSPASNQTQLYLLQESSALAGPTITTPQTAISGVVEWESVASAYYYEVFEAFSPTPPIGTEGVVQVDGTSYLPQNWGQTYVLVRSVTNGQRSQWSTAVFFSKTVPRFTIPNNLLQESHSSYYSTLRRLQSIDTEPMFFTSSSYPYRTSGRVDIQVYHNGTQVDESDPLLPGEYRFRAQAIGERNGVGTVTSEWTEFQTMHVIANGIHLVTPFEAQPSVRPTFRWTRYYGEDYWLNDGATYTLRVDNETTGETNVVLASGLTDLNYTPDFDLPAGNYRAWVRPADFNQQRDWSEEIKFSIGMEITGLSPTGQVATSQPTITWNALDVPDVTYEVWVNQHEGQKKIVHATGLTDNQFAVNQTLDDGLYRVFVRAHFDNGETSAWSETAEFSVGDAVVPIITAPADSISDRTPTIDWTAATNATHYRVHVRNLTTNENLVFEQDGITSTEITLTEELADGQYSVWVRGYAGGQPVTVWSPPASFYVGEFPTLTGPGELVDPPYFTNEPYWRADYTGSPVGFNWTEVAGAVSYEFRLSHLQAGARAMSKTNIQQTSITSDYPLPTGTYRGWVRALNADGNWTRWSDPVEFTVADSDANADGDASAITTEALAEGRIEMAMLTPAITNHVEDTDSSKPTTDRNAETTPPASDEQQIPPAQDTPHDPIMIAEQFSSDPDALIDMTFRDFPLQDLIDV